MVGSLNLIHSNKELLLQSLLHYFNLPKIKSAKKRSNRLRVKSFERSPLIIPHLVITEVPMNKVQVGAAPSPNLKSIRSKIGSLENATHKPGGGKIKIENRKLDFSSAQAKIAAKNDKYTPSGGDKKVG